MRSNNILWIAAALLMAGAATAGTPIPVAGTVGDVPFPSRDSAWLKKGDFVNVENLRQMKRDIDKDQVRLLLGNPHFKEGFVGVDEWNYLFNFRTGVDEEYITCQYQVRYRKESGYAVDSMHWDGPACKDLLNKPETAPVAAAPQQTHYDFSSEALFRFARWAKNDILPGGRESLEAVATQLKKAEPSRVRVVGHTDQLGNEQANEALSERRAETVKRYLADKGVPGDIVTEGRGERDPVKPLEQCQGQSHEALVACLVPNRRVELIVEGMR